MRRLPSLSATRRLSAAQKLSQFMTPIWAAEALLDRFYPNLSSQDVVIEPTCGRGAFLQAIPLTVSAVGIEIDPQLAREAHERTGRRIIVGDFRTVPIDLQPTVIIGNPPFCVRTVEGILDRAHALLPPEGQVGFVLPTYLFQTAARVVRYIDTWSIAQEMIPRNIFPGLSKPLTFAVFTKNHRRLLFGFALYRETAALADFDDDTREILERGRARGSVWTAAIRNALERLGGTATLSNIYAAMERNRPTATRFWREQIRKVLMRDFQRVADSTYAIPT